MLHHIHSTHNQICIQACLHGWQAWFCVVFWCHITSYNVMLTRICCIESCHTYSVTKVVLTLPSLNQTYPKESLKHTELCKYYKDSIMICLHHAHSFVRTLSIIIIFAVAASVWYDMHMLSSCTCMNKKSFLDQDWAVPHYYSTWWGSSLDCVIMPTTTCVSLLHTTLMLLKKIWRKTKCSTDILMSF